MRASRDGFGVRRADADGGRPIRARHFGAFPQGWAAAALWGLDIAVASGVSTVVAQTAASEALAIVNGEAISAKDVEKSLGAKLAKLEEQIYTLKRAEVDALIAQRLLAQEAAKRGISVATLMDEEITSKVALVTETEIDDYYKANKARMRGDEATVRPQIRSSLQQQKLTARQDAFLASLRSKAKIVVRLEPPAAARVDVAIAGAPLRGAADAAVTIVEFSDFECPFCKQAKHDRREADGKVFGQDQARLPRLSAREHSSAGAARRRGRAVRPGRRKILGVPRRAVRSIPEACVRRPETLREPGGARRRKI